MMIHCIVAVTAVSLAISPAASAGLKPGRALVTAPSGRYAGIDEGRTSAFRGIRFAQPPTGERRWQPPVPLGPLPGLQDATRFGPDCMQIADPSSRAPGVSEDCLTLNIWKPHTARKLPVMVWIYGGGFTGGSGALPLYDGAALARRGIVIVTFNYRVGVFGFLAHPGLTAESPVHASGNYGLMDQLAALRWVKANIAAFGGDPSNVTAFGQSAGGSSLSHLIVSRQAHGLFEKAILQSPGAMRPLASLAEAERTGSTLSPDITFLRAMPAVDLLALNARIIPAVRSLTAPRALGPIQDGWIVRSGEGSAYAAGDVNRMPVMLGGNADEGRAFVSNWPIRTDADYRAYLDRNFAESASAAQALYPENDGFGIPQALARLFADTQYHYGIRGIARGMSALNQPVWRYQFDHPSSRQTLAPTHGDELKFVFGNLGDPSQTSAGDRTISRTIMTAWVAFARTGNPNAPGTPRWPIYNRGEERYRIFGDSRILYGARYRQTELDFLARFFSVRVRSRNEESI